MECSCKKTWEHQGAVERDRITGLGSTFHRLRASRLLCWDRAAELAIVGWALKGLGTCVPKTGGEDAPKLKLPIGLFTAAAAALKLNPPVVGRLTPAAPPPNANDEAPNGVGLDAAPPQPIFAGEPLSEWKADSTVRLACSPIEKTDGELLTEGKVSGNPDEVDAGTIGCEAPNWKALGEAEKLKPPVDVVAVAVLPATPFASPVLLKAKGTAVVLAGRPKVDEVDVLETGAGNPKRLGLAVTLPEKLKAPALVFAAGAPGTLAEKVNRGADVVVATAEKQNEDVVLACVNREGVVVLAAEKLNPLMLNPVAAVVVVVVTTGESFPGRTENGAVSPVLPDGVEVTVFAPNLKVGAVNPVIIAGFVVVAVVDAEEGVKVKPKDGIVPVTPELEEAVYVRVVADGVDTTVFGKEKGKEGLKTDEDPVGVVDERDVDLAEKLNTGVELDEALDIADVVLAEKLNAGVFPVTTDCELEEVMAEKLNIGVADAADVVEETGFPKKLNTGAVEVVSVSAAATTKGLAEVLKSGAEDEPVVVVDEDAEMLSNGVFVAGGKLNPCLVLVVADVGDPGKLKLGAAVYTGLDEKLGKGTDEVARVVTGEILVESKFDTLDGELNFRVSVEDVSFSDDVVNLVEVGVFTDGDDSSAGFLENEKLNPAGKSEVHSGEAVDFDPKASDKFVVSVVVCTGADVFPMEEEEGAIDDSELAVETILGANEHVVDGTESNGADGNAVADVNVT
ncbi:hypothetical protein Aperf_G00000087462 [Anoplocephala perfoliata]